MDVITLAVAKKYTDDAIVRAATGDIDIEKHVAEEIAKVVDSAPDTLNTLNELAVALGDDPNFATTIATQIGNKVDKVSGKGLSTNDFTNAYKNKVDSALQSYAETDPTVPAWAKAEAKPTYTASEVGAVPTSRTVNGKALSGNITLNASDVGALPNTTSIPTALEGLTDDATHRLVTDTEKATWNAKSDFSGSYNDLTDKPTIPSIDGLATTKYVDDAVANIVLTSEGGKRFKLAVDDNGVLTAVEVTE